MEKVKGIKVIGTSLNSNEVDGSVTVEVPVAQLGILQDKLGVESAVGSWLPNSQMGERYGLRPDTQTIALPIGREQEITLARDLYRSEPIVANVIDLMVDFSATGMENRCSDAKAKKYFDTVCKYGDMDSIHRYIFKEYFISSDVFILRSGKQLVPFGPSKGEEFFKWTVLNPNFVQVDSPLVFEGGGIGIRPNSSLLAMIQEKPKYNRKLTALPKELRDAAINGGVYYPPEIKVSRISRKKQPYERYATPFLARVFEPVLIKRRMREADLALAETVKSVLITFTIGDKDFPATQAQLNSFADMLKTPSKSMELVWNHTLKVDYHFPDASLFDTAKYEQVNTDITQGLGIPPVLIDGGGGTFATAFTSLLAVIERLETVRNEVARWQEAEYLRIAQEQNLNFKSIPSVFFTPLNLRDEKVFAAFLINLYDRGLISIETFMSLTDLELEVETRNRIAEKETKLETIFKPRKVAPDKPAAAKPKTGRPTGDVVDPGNYTTREQIPAVPTGPPKTKPKVNPRG